MKIAVIGTQNIGKSTYIEDFIQNWPQYTLCKKPRYTDNTNLKLNEDGDEESQRFILNSLIDQVSTSTEKDLIFDRSVLDNLVYTLWLNQKGKVSDTFVKESIALVKESLVFYDILFFLPITKFSDIPMEEKQNRSSSKTYREEIDNIFKSLFNSYSLSNKTFFPFENSKGCPAMIDIFGNRQERMQLTKMYINEDGESYSEKENLLATDDEDQKAMESLSSKIITPGKNIISIKKS